ncbi:MAG: ABC-2 transporter permease [Clostridia bacterium]|nr:ABC-2 transporter permease [Clostridia bacterium]
MKGLLYKDFLMAWKYCKMYLVITVVFLALFFFNTDSWYFVVYPGILVGMIPINLLAYDEHSRWKIFSQTLPYSKDKVVSVKYLVGLIPTTLFTVLVSVVYGISRQIENRFSLSEMGGILFVVFFLPLLFSAFSLPLVFRFGTEKGRMVSLIGVAAVCGFTFAYVAFRKVSYTISIPTITPTIFLIIGTIILALYVLSWKLSIALYQKNTFYPDRRKSWKEILKRK